jgi:hypothetical protein
MGFQYAVLFPRGREAIRAWTEITERPVRLPTNICPVARDWSAFHTLHDIDETGLAPGITTQLYGYREEGDGKSELDLDPLGTGFFARPCATSGIVSFGEKKFITIGGAAFVTNDQALAQEMEPRGYWPPAITEHVKLYLAALSMLRDKRRDKVYLWDRHLGDSLQRINREQIIPWRVMRLAKDRTQRDRIVDKLRDCRDDIGTNYPPLVGQNSFGDRVLNFFLTDDYDERRIQDACGTIKGVVAA